MSITTLTVVDGEVISEDRSGVKRDYVPDLVGSIVALLDNTQTQTDTFNYWPNGEVQSSSGSSTTSFRFLGSLGYYQDTSSRTYVRMRYLSTQSARWITSDPIEEGVNWYSYVGNNPLVFIDPFGLDIKIIGDDKRKKWIIGIIKKLKQLPIGKKLIAPFEGPNKHLYIIPGQYPQANPPGGNSGYISWPNDWKKILPIEVGKPSKPQHIFPSPERALAHELGHYAYPNPSGPSMDPSNPDLKYEGEIIKRFENPVAKALGELPRTSYDLYPPPKKK